MFKIKSESVKQNSHIDKCSDIDEQGRQMRDRARRVICNNRGEAIEIE